ncbi:MAG: hypothetical protein JWR63_1787 [Conexibacter sp.]|nr:hypothetical protein [Conexibacter sp.]
MARPMPRLLVTLLAMAATAVALWALSSHPTKAGAASADADAITAALARSYPVLGHPGSSRDLGTGRPTTVADLAKDMPSLLPLKGRILGADAARTLVLVPRIDGQICLVQLLASGDAGINCNTPDKTPILLNYGRATGVVPAGVAQVTFTLADGTTSTIKPDADGRYDAPAEATSARFTAGGTPAEIELLPASARPAGVTEAQ